MKIRKAVGYLIMEQRELEVDFLLDDTQISEIVNSFFNKIIYSKITSKNIYSSQNLDHLLQLIYY